MLRRLERGAMAFCSGGAALALALRAGDPSLAAGILGGGVLVFVSYWAIRSSVSAILTVASPGTDDSGPSRPALLLRLVGRYALLSLLAYVMIARFRLHPVGLLLGVSSLFAAASLETVRAIRERGQNRRA